MDGFGIELPMKFDMPLNKETKPNKTKAGFNFKNYFLIMQTIECGETVFFNIIIFITRDIS